MSTDRRIYVTVAATGDAGKTIIARHVIAPGSGGDLLTLETHSPDDGSGLIDEAALGAYLYAPPGDGTVLDIGVGDAVAALETLALIARQDRSLPQRLRLVVPLLPAGKCVAGLRWLIAQLPGSLRPAVHAVWNRVRREDEASLRDGEIARAARAVARQSGARLIAPVLHESPLLDPIHPLMRRYGSLAAVAGITDDEIRATSLSDMPSLLVGRDAAQAAVADCRAIYTAINDRN